MLRNKSLRCHMIVKLQWCICTIYIASGSFRWTNDRGMGEFNGTTVSSIKGAPTTGSLASKQANHKGTQTCDACLLTEKHAPAWTLTVIITPQSSLQVLDVVTHISQNLLVYAYYWSNLYLESEERECEEVSVPGGVGGVGEKNYKVIASPFPSPPPSPHFPCPAPLINKQSKKSKHCAISVT